jgi:hypothetical protein
VDIFRYRERRRPVQESQAGERETVAPNSQAGTVLDSVDEAIDDVAERVPLAIMSADLIDAARSNKLLGADRANSFAQRVLARTVVVQGCLRTMLFTPIRLRLRTLMLGIMLAAFVVGALVRMPLALEGFAENSREEQSEREMLNWQLEVLEGHRQLLAHESEAFPQSGCY